MAFCTQGAKGQEGQEQDDSPDSIKQRRDSRQLLWGKHAQLSFHCSSETVMNSILLKYRDGRNFSGDFCSGFWLIGTHEFRQKQKSKYLMNSKIMPLTGHHQFQNLDNLISEKFQVKITSGFFLCPEEIQVVRSCIICRPWHNTSIESKAFHQMT